MNPLAVFTVFTFLVGLVLLFYNMFIWVREKTAEEKSYWVK